ncbi:MAG: hypothetical protein KGR70_16460 [Cyanobacteria bacterium REEB494]|nr:hypothetical protein [Cyanobacteria bacterium REEB494]
MRSTPFGRSRSTRAREIAFSVPPDSFSRENSECIERRLRSTPYGRSQSTPYRRLRSTTDGRLRSTPRGRSHYTPNG